MFKLMDKKIIAILRKLFLLNWPYEFATTISARNVKCTTRESFGRKVSVRLHKKDG